MSCSRKIVLVLLALILAATLLPFTREKVDWAWAHAEKKSESYLNYLGRWPDGSHAELAKTALAKARALDETKADAAQAQNLYAMSFKTNSKAKAENKAARELKLDEFFWRRVKGANTDADYKLYLDRFPVGKHAAEARQALGTPSPPPGQ